MKKQIKDDERILVQRQKILSEACVLLMVSLIASMLIQRYLFDAPFKQYVAEFICFFVVSIYTLIRNLMLGINIFGEEKKTKKITLIYSIVIGILVATINGISNYIKYGEHYEGNFMFFAATLFITFVSATLITFIVLALFAFFNHKKQKQIQKELDEQEQDN